MPARHPCRSSTGSSLARQRPPPDAHVPSALTYGEPSLVCCRNRIAWAHIRSCGPRALNQLLGRGGTGAVGIECRCLTGKSCSSARECQLLCSPRFGVRWRLAQMSAAPHSPRRLSVCSYFVLRPGSGCYLSRADTIISQCECCSSREACLAVATVINGVGQCCSEALRAIKASISGRLRRCADTTDAAEPFATPTWKSW